MLREAAGPTAPLILIHKFKLMCVWDLITLRGRSIWHNISPFLCQAVLDWNGCGTLRFVSLMQYIFLLKRACYVWRELQNYSHSLPSAYLWSQNTSAIGVFMETRSSATVRQKKKVCYIWKLKIGRAPQGVKLLKLWRKIWQIQLNLENVNTLWESHIVLLLQYSKTNQNAIWWIDYQFHSISHLSVVSSKRSNCVFFSRIPWVPEVFSREKKTSGTNG